MSIFIKSLLFYFLEYQNWPYLIETFDENCIVNDWTYYWEFLKIQSMFYKSIKIVNVLFVAFSERFKTFFKKISWAQFNMIGTLIQRPCGGFRILNGVGGGGGASLICFNTRLQSMKLLWWFETLKIKLSKSWILFFLL